jgi:ferrous iron transport protein B
MLERGWAFVRRAGTLIVAVAIIVWALLYYPHDSSVVERSVAQERAALAAQLARLPADDARQRLLEAELARYDDTAQQPKLLAGAYQRQSILGRVGRLIEPAVRPLGWDWRVGCAAIASFPAREVVLGTLGVIYNLGDVDLKQAEGQTQLQSQLRAATWDDSSRPVFTIPMALGLMVFFALCAQCAATLVVIKRETQSWRWPVFTFAYMTVLAYLGALATYQIGTWLSG